jgi:hypothetical protein
MQKPFSDKAIKQMQTSSLIKAAYSIRKGNMKKQEPDSSMP